MVKDNDLLKYFTEAIEPVVKKAFSEALQEFKGYDDDIIGIDEASEITKIAKQTLYTYSSSTWRKRNPDKTPPPMNKRGGRLYFSRKKLREWLLNSNDKK